MVDRILRVPKVVHRCGTGRATNCRGTAEEDCPRLLRLGDSAVGWREGNIGARIADLPEASTDPEPRPRRRPPMT